ncbi:MAG TPA: hypothetical protein VEY51_00975 [Chondromyces sp.]|nr:hypothetical protein [Chondromyces sp.]
MNLAPTSGANQTFTLLVEAVQYASVYANEDIATVSENAHHRHGSFRQDDLLSNCRRGSGPRL